MKFLNLLLALVKSPQAVWDLVVKYGPLVAALFAFIHKSKDNKARAAAMDGVTRGLKIATETGDPSELEKAIRSHCGPNGCRLP